MKTRRSRSRKSAAISNSHRGKVAPISSSRWTAYATAGAASALACVPTAEGDIHYSGLINQVFNDTTNDMMPVQDYFPLDQPLTQGGNSINPAHNRRTDSLGFAAFYVYGNLPAVAGFSASAGGGTYPYLSKLSFGQLINARPFLANGNATYPGAYGRFAAGSGYPNEQWKDAGIGFVGFRFDNGGGPQYGWARIDISGTPDNSFTLVDFAWADLGDSITAGQVPEPGSLALLALGGAGLLAWRKRRAKAAASL